MEPNRGDNNLSEDKISRLLGRSASGDERAFAELVKLMEKRICAFFRTRGLSVYDAEEATQELFLNIFNGLARYDINRPAEPWIWTIAGRIACDFFKRSTHYNAIIICGDTVLEAPSECDVRNEVALNEMLKQISCLTTLDSQVLTMAILGLTSHEIAAHIGLSHASVRQRLSRIRNKFRAWIAHSHASSNPGCARKNAKTDSPLICQVR
jgi:RNA polymerase sigma-70 factor (ECF subfamily)